ncbi:hypothetical protein KFL_012640010 [Klebsormidium nitens]|uniref:Kinesin motor domain-containing protein n=1 Tax=Klebsormidium nitens TaxID=105231 RepID=A0A1Y1IVW5_KLENI|nr:hypothetical protein KFL_012640010 [Klebsormidium nitens]|eukprot:GAQ93036.1 hypothetical protein KFL_012640010 [Klebsormidium nitens]
MSPPAGVKKAGLSENVTVTVRFRPLSVREARRGEDVAWYADGDHFVRLETNPNICYAFDKVFGPASTTRVVYDVAAQHVVQGAMNGVNGTVFAYGVTSSGKTHTMHGDKKSPGVIPLAVKDVFSLIQDAPDREFLLRVSYLEIYNEVINDLLDPARQNLKIREDPQGTYVEGVKHEVVISPAHALSFIQIGEANRHVGSTNYNLVSSRSHTIFCLTIEQSPRGAAATREQVVLSQLNLIDLAGSESSKAETTGLRRKEGSYINRSLLTLGTVIAKLSEGKPQHIPYRDSKLTRLLQSSLSGHGRISLICTITPASGALEETHNTVKFARRAKHVEIALEKHKIMDERSLIKKYQREINELRQELESLRASMASDQRSLPDLRASPSASEEDLTALRQQIEEEQNAMQARLEEEEANKAALVERINRLTRLILVSTQDFRDEPSPKELSTTRFRRNKSFGEDELSFLSSRAREPLLPATMSRKTSETASDSGELDSPALSVVDEPVNTDEKKKKKRGFLGLFKSKDKDKESPSLGKKEGSKPVPSTPPAASGGTSPLHPLHRTASLVPSRTVEMVKEKSTAGDLFTATKRGLEKAHTGQTYVDQLDLLREQVRLLADEIKLRDSTIRRLSEQAEGHPAQEAQITEKLEKLRAEVKEKRRNVAVLESRIQQQMEADVEKTPAQLVDSVNRLKAALGEKEFAVEMMTADNRILQEQLKAKAQKAKKVEEELVQVKAALAARAGEASPASPSAPAQEVAAVATGTDASTVSRALDFDGVVSRETQAGAAHSEQEDEWRLQVLSKVAEIEALKSQLESLVSEKEALRLENEQLRASQENAEARGALAAALAQHGTAARRENGDSAPSEWAASRATPPAEVRGQADGEDGSDQGPEGPKAANGSQDVESEGAGGGRAMAGKASMAEESPGARSGGARASAPDDLQRLSEDNRALRAKLDELRSKSGALLRSPGTPPAPSRDASRPSTPATPGPQQTEPASSPAASATPGPESAGDLIEDARLNKAMRSGGSSPLLPRLNGEGAGSPAAKPEAVSDARGSTVETWNGERRLYTGRIMGAEQEKALMKMQKMLEEARNREARLEAELAKARRVSKSGSSSEAGVATSPDGTAVAANDNVCSGCLRQPATTVLLPCRHLCCELTSLGA